MKYTKEEFKYLMGFYGYRRIPIFYHNDFVGYITDDFEYVHNDCRYMTNKEDAINLALEQIDSWHEKVEKFRSEEIVSLTALHIVENDTWNYDDGDGVVRHHIYPKKVVKTTEEEWSGTYDKLFEDMFRINSKLRYCNGHMWKFKDAEIRELYHAWHKYISNSRSMDIYYGGGTVD